MNYEDELERSRARRSRKRESTAQHREFRTADEERWNSLAEPGSRAGRNKTASHGNHYRRKKKPNKKKKIIIGVLIGILVLLAALVGGAYAYLNHHVSIAQGNNPFEKSDVINFDLAEDVREQMEKGYWTIAIFGLDSRDSSTGAGNQSDVIMIANINRETGEIKLVSVFRDTYLNINDRNTYNKINAAYAEGGPTQALKALNKNLDLNITDYIAFNWKAVATGINILGGVDIEISKSEFYYINAFITETVKGTGIGSVQLKSAGLHHLDGVQAVAYGRLRLMDSDYARTERQRLVIQKAFEQAKKSDLATLNSLVGNMAAMCSTSIDTNEILAMAKNVKKYHLGETMGFPAARSEKRIKIGSNNLSCVVPQTLVSNVTSLHSFLFGTEDYTPSSTVQTISKKISDVSGLYNAGTEIGHVATDQGYVPKATTTAAAAEETKKTEEASESSEEETLEGESSTAETSEGETLESTAEESGSSEESGVHPGELESEPTSGEGSHMGPAGPSNETTRSPYDEEYDRPKSPQDMTRETEQQYGPGFEDEPVTEATKAVSSPGSGTETSGTGNQSSVIIVSPTTGYTSPSSTSSPASGNTSPSSPADETASTGSTSGPASQATVSAGPASGL